MRLYPVDGLPKLPVRHAHTVARFDLEAGASRPSAVTRTRTIGRQGGAGMSDEPFNWLHSALGREGSPTPPDLGSERIKSIIGRALLTPGDLSPSEVQELAASALSYLVSTKGVNR